MTKTVLVLFLMCVLVGLLGPPAAADEIPSSQAKVRPFVSFIHLSSTGINTVVVGLELSRVTGDWTFRFDFGWSTGTPPSGTMAQLLGAPWLNYAQITFMLDNL